MTANYKHSEAEAFFDTLTPESILATLHANREARRAQGEKIFDRLDGAETLGIREQKAQESPARVSFDTLGLRAGVALADRLIAAHGGKARQRIEFWHYLAEWQKGRDVLRPTEET